MGKGQRKRQQLTMAGEYAVCAELSKLGFDVNLTLGNSKGVDILVFFEDKTYTRIEVKTTRSNKHIITGFFQKYYDINKLHPDIWVLVQIDNENKFHFFVLTHNEVAELQMIRNKQTEYVKNNGVDNLLISDLLKYENMWEKINN